MKSVDNQMIDHILKKIKNTQLLSSPYDHVIIDNFIPNKDYKLLAEELNDINLKESDNSESVDYWTEKGEGVGERICSFVKEEDSFPNWLTINNFSSKWIKDQRKIFQALCEKFNVEDSYEYLDFSICKDETNYKIQPHTDQPHNFFTLLFYCPTTTKNKELGLSIFEEGSGDVYLTRDGEHRTLKEVKKAEFLPNRLICFKRTENSWHAVDHKNNTLQGSRNSFQIFFMKQ
jgi:hypothetical protein